MQKLRAKVEAEGRLSNVSNGVHYQIIRDFSGGLFTMAALSLPVITLISKNIEYDEAITLLEISGHANPSWPQSISLAADLKSKFNDISSLSILYKSLLNSDVHPPLYFTVIWIFRAIFEVNLLAIRIISFAFILIGLMSILRVWQRSTELSTNAHNLYFVAIFMTVPSLYYAATTARPYAMAIALLCLAYSGVHALWTSPAEPRSQVLRAAGTGAACGAAVATNYLALFIATTLGAAALFVLVRRRCLWGVAALIAAAAPFIFVVIFFLSAQIDARPEQHAGFIGVAGLTARLLAGLILGVPNASPPYSLLNLLPAILLCAVIGGAVNAAIRRNSQARGPVMLIAIHVSGLVVLSWLTDKTLMSSRYLSLAGPFLALTLAYGLERLAAWSAHFLSLPVLANGTVIVSLMVAGQFAGTFYHRASGRVAETPAAQTVLLTDVGFGRGTPASVIVSVAPETRLWFRRLSDVQAKEFSTLPETTRYVYVLASPYYPPSVEALARLRTTIQAEGWEVESYRKLFVRFVRSESPG